MLLSCCILLHTDYDDACNDMALRHFGKLRNVLDVCQDSCYIRAEE